MSWPPRFHRLLGIRHAAAAAASPSLDAVNGAITEAITDLAANQRLVEQAVRKRGGDDA